MLSAYNIRTPGTRLVRRKSGVPSPWTLLSVYNIRTPGTRLVRRTSGVPSSSTLLSAYNIRTPGTRLGRRKSRVPSPLTSLSVYNIRTPGTRLVRRKMFITILLFKSVRVSIRWHDWSPYKRDSHGLLYWTYQPNMSLLKPFNLTIKFKMLFELC